MVSSKRQKGRGSCFSPPPSFVDDPHSVCVRNCPYSQAVDGMVWFIVLQATATTVRNEPGTPALDNPTDFSSNNSKRATKLAEGPLLHHLTAQSPSMISGFVCLNSQSVMNFRKMERTGVSSYEVVWEKWGRSTTAQIESRLISPNCAPPSETCASVQVYHGPGIKPQASDRDRCRVRRHYFCITACRLHGLYPDLSWTFSLPSADPPHSESKKKAEDPASSQGNRHFSSILFEH